MATLRNPADGLRYGCVSRVQLFGSAAAAPFYNCLSRAIASLACGNLRIPFIGYYEGAGVVAPRPLVKIAVRSFTELNGELFFMFKEYKSQAGSLLEPQGLQSALYKVATK